ncbi:MAG: hypothetical protein V7750_17020 [Sneathiella sp.]
MNNSRFTRQKYILQAQLFYFALVIFWNIAGVVLIANDMRAPGPTASLLAAGIMALLAPLLIYGWRQRTWLYVVISGLSFTGAMAAVYQAFSANPDLWPSDFWRYCGVSLNIFGILAHSFAIFAKLLVRGAHLKGQ